MDRATGHTSSTAHRHVQSSVVAGWTLIAAFCLVAASIDGAQQYARAFQLAYLAGFVGYFLVAFALWRQPQRVPGSWPLWLAGFILLRLILIATEPSDDVNRYLWEGRIQLHGFNPFVLAPDDPDLFHLRDEHWAGINHPDYPTIYPPAAQLLFLVVAWMSSAPLAMKLLFAALDVATVLVLSRLAQRLGKPPQWSAIYAHCPLVLTAFAIEGHLDSAMLLALSVTAWAVVARRPAMAGIALGLAITAKIVAVILLAWFAWRMKKAAVIAILVVVVSYLPYASAGSSLFESLTRFGHESASFSIPALVSAAIEPLWTIRPAVVAYGLAVLLGPIMLWRGFRDDDFCRFAAMAFGALLIALPTVHLWYLSWVIVFAPMYPLICFLAMACAAVGYFGVYDAPIADGVWIMPAWSAPLAWGTLVIAMALEYRFRRMRVHCQ